MKSVHSQESGEELGSDQDGLDKSADKLLAESMLSKSYDQLIDAQGNASRNNNVQSFTNPYIQNIKAMQNSHKNKGSDQ